MSDAAIRQTNAAQAEAAYDRFIKPMLDTMRADYLTKLAEMAARPMTEQNTAAVVNLSLAIRIANEIEVQMRAQIADGVIAANDAAHASKLANMSHEERRWATYGSR